MKKMIFAACLFVAGIAFTAQASFQTLVNTSNEITIVDQEPVKEKAKTSCCSSASSCTEKEKAACKGEKTTNTTEAKSTEKKATESETKSKTEAKSCCSSHQKK
jgi:hypothetical protein